MTKAMCPSGIASPSSFTVPCTSVLSASPHPHKHNMTHNKIAELSFIRHLLRESSKKSRSHDANGTMIAANRRRRLLADAFVTGTGAQGGPGEWRDAAVNPLYGAICHGRVDTPLGVVITACGVDRFCAA